MLILSANDGFNAMVDGRYQPRADGHGGSLAGIDAASRPPRVLWSVPVDHSVIGPPSGLAVSPDGAFAFVGNPGRPGAKAGPDGDLPHEVQVIDVRATPPRVVASVAVPLRPFGLALSPDGTKLLAGTGTGTILVLDVAGGTVTFREQLRLGPDSAKTMAVAFTPDGSRALVSKRGDDTVAVLRVGADGTLTDTGHDITTGSNPYDIRVTADGRLAAVSNVGRGSGDDDSVTLIDLTAARPHAAGTLGVAQTPESLAFSHDGKLLAVSAINGSNLPKADPAYSAHARVQLFDVGAAPPRLIGSADVGGNIQGVLFDEDDRRLFVQDFVGARLLILHVSPDGLHETGESVPMDGGPAAIVAVPTTPAK